MENLLPELPYDETFILVGDEGSWVAPGGNDSIVEMCGLCLCCPILPPFQELECFGEFIGNHHYRIE